MVEIISSNSNLTVYVGTALSSADFLLECRRIHLGVDDGVKVVKTPLGAPYFSDGSIYVSLSHTRGVCVAALSNRRVGVDVERLDRQVDYKTVGKRWFSKDYASKDDFLIDWTRYEALAKLNGQGLLPIVEHVGTVAHYKYNGYLVAVATN